MDTLERMEAKLDEITRILNKVLPVVEQHEAVERQREILRQEEGKLKSRYKSAFDQVANQGSTDSEISSVLSGEQEDIRSSSQQHSSSSKVRRLPTRSEERVG